jgi:hypothetical protein
LTTLSEVYERTTTALQTSGATRLVKTLQMIQLQKAIMTIGMFSMFEAMLQDELKCRDGFKEAKIILKENNCSDLCEKFIDLELSINILKHGKGKSYSALIAKNGGTLKNYIKELNVENYEEGDVSEINTLIDVDDNFVNYCSEIILQVAEVIRKSNPVVNL